MAELIALPIKYVIPPWKANEQAPAPQPQQPSLRAAQANDRRAAGTCTPATPCDRL